MSFMIDHRISSTCFELAEWPLSRVYLKNNANYPWFILVPRQENITNINQLSSQLRHVLVDEISELSSIVSAYFKPDKLNVGALGNLVPQLHIHVIARFAHDELWPHGVWQSAQTTKPYEKYELDTLLDHFSDATQRYSGNGS